MVSQKHGTALACYNFEEHGTILIIFGKNVAKKVSSQTVLHFPTSSGKTESQKLRFLRQCRSGWVWLTVNGYVTDNTNRKWNSKSLMTLLWHYDKHGVKHLHTSVGSLFRKYSPMPVDPHPLAHCVYFCTLFCPSAYTSTNSFRLRSLLLSNHLFAVFISAFSALLYCRYYAVKTEVGLRRLRLSPCRPRFNFNFEVADWQTHVTNSIAVDFVERKTEWRLEY